MSVVAVGERRSTRRKTFKASVVNRVIALLLLVVMAGSLLTHEASRRLEASLAGWAIENFLGMGTEQPPEGTLLIIGLRTQHVFILDITFACSVTLLLAPLFLIAAGLLFTGRASLFRTLPAVVVGCAALIAVNTARFLLMAAMTSQGGDAGFGWAHTVWGSLMVLIGLSVVGIVFVRVVTRSSTKGGRR